MHSLDLETQMKRTDKIRICCQGASAAGLRAHTKLPTTSKAFSCLECSLTYEGETKCGSQQQQELPASSAASAMVSRDLEAQLGGKLGVMVLGLSHQRLVLAANGGHAGIMLGLHHLQLVCEAPHLHGSKLHEDTLPGVSMLCLAGVASLQPGDAVWWLHDLLTVQNGLLSILHVGCWQHGRWQQ